MVLKGSGLVLCSVFTLYFGGSPFIYTPAPRGECSNCCPIRERKDIQFLLYTRSNPQIPDFLYPSDEKHLETSHLNTSDPLILYLHGFSEHAGSQGQSSQEIRDAFLERGTYNVILVDSSPLTALPWYVNSVKNSPKVAKYVAKFLRFLVQSGMEIEKIHVIGFSLGAEVAGFVGQSLKEFGMVLPRITGLDPALPLYMFGSDSSRLSSADAKFVDVIHTDGGILGYPGPLGHVDFYPNGGVPIQPGCAAQEIAKNRWINVILGCSHQRSWEYFVESIRHPKAFMATRCEAFAENSLSNCYNETIAYMGLNANDSLRGKFYLTTNGEPPFGNNIPK